MGNNPYQTPKSDAFIVREFKRSVWWKMYFFFITILSAIGMVSFLFEPGTGVSEYINLGLWLVATVGLYGFTFLKPISKPKFWLQILIVYIVFSFAYYFITDVDLRQGMSDATFYITAGIGWVLTLPTFYALYALSKPTDPNWDGLNGKR